MNIEKDRKIALEALDAAITFRTDGDIELLLGEEDMPIIPDNIRWALAVMYALKDEELSQLIERHFEKECMRIKVESRMDTYEEKPKEEHVVKEKKLSEFFEHFKKPDYSKPSNLVNLSTFRKG